MNRHKWIITPGGPHYKEPEFPRCSICGELGRERGGNCIGHIDENGQRFEFVGAIPPRRDLEYIPLREDI